MMVAASWHPSLGAGPYRAPSRRAPGVPRRRPPEVGYRGPDLSLYTRARVRTEILEGDQPGCVNISGVETRNTNESGYIGVTSAPI